MEITFKNKRLEKSITDPKASTKAFGKIKAKKIKQRYQEMLASENLEELSKIPAAYLHPLVGDRKEQWAVKITGNERLCFIIEHAPVPLLADNSVDKKAVTDIRIVFVGDYH